MPKLLRPTLTAMFHARVQATPEAIGFQYKPTTVPAGVTPDWKKVSFRQFYDECREVSLGLLALGIRPGDKVAILSNTRYEWALSDMAVLAAGAVTVPVYPSNSARDAAFIIAHSDACLAIVEDLRQLEKILEKRAELPQIRKIVVLDPTDIVMGTGREDILTLAELRELGARQMAKQPPGFFDEMLLAAKPDDLFTICYTSGTTGVPKGTMLTHDNMVSILEDCSAALDSRIRPECEVLLTFLPFSHILGRVEEMATYMYGFRECYAENFDKLMTNIAEVCPTMIFAVPRIFEKAYARIMGIIESGPTAKRRVFTWASAAGRRYFAHEWDGTNRSLRDYARYGLAQALIWKKIKQRFGGRLSFAICGGAPLPKEIGEFFQVAGIRVLEGYGLTETCAPVSLNTHEASRFGSVGRPLRDVKIRIAEDGEICIQSRKVFKGYYKMPAESAEAFEGGWLHTGDIGYLDSEGFLHVTDRKKDIIVTSGGKNIAPQKIENIAKSYAFITQLVVHGDRRNYLTALVTLDRDRLVSFANENRILFTEYGELVRHSSVRGLVQTTIDQINAQLATFETIKKFTILPNELTIESGELTPSLKVKRSVIGKRYQAELDAMYTA